MDYNYYHYFGLSYSGTCDDGRKCVPVEHDELVRIKATTDQEDTIKALEDLKIYPHTDLKYFTIQAKRNSYCGCENGKSELSNILNLVLIRIY